MIFLAFGAIGFLVAGFTGAAVGILLCFAIFALTWAGDV